MHKHICVCVCVRAVPRDPASQAGVPDAELSICQPAADGPGVAPGLLPPAPPPLLPPQPLPRLPACRQVTGPGICNTGLCQLSHLPQLLTDAVQFTLRPVDYVK